jgi:Fe-S-cluster containining protein
MNRRSRIKFVSVTCSRCAGCCRDSIVPVTDMDVRRLSASLGIPPSRIVAFYSNSEMLYDTDAPLWIRFASGKRAMGLRRVNGRCCFLSRGKSCSVYVSRPLTCRTFPYQIDLDVREKVIAFGLNSTIRCKCTKKQIRRISRDLIRDVRREKIEDDVYCAKVSRWNDIYRSKSATAFMEFLGFF